MDAGFDLRNMIPGIQYLLWIVELTLSIVQSSISENHSINCRITSHLVLSTRKLYSIIVLNNLFKDCS